MLENTDSENNSSNERECSEDDSSNEREGSEYEVSDDMESSENESNNKKKSENESCDSDSDTSIKENFSGRKRVIGVKAKIHSFFSKKSHKKKR